MSEGTPRAGKSNGNGATPPPSPLSEDDYGNNWLAACQTGRRNTEPRPNLYNAVLAIQHDPHWRGVFGFDEMLQTSVRRDGSKPLEDPDYVEALHWMHEHGLETMGIEAARMAVEHCARKHRFHPLRDYLTNLEWDGEGRLTEWLARYVGTTADNYHASIGYWFLLSMVARVMQPGCKCDYMMVLEGPQGIRKSEVCAILGGEYFSDTLPDLSGDQVRVSMHIRGKWLIEVAELHAFSRVELTRLKSFLTTKVEQYTPKFARKEVYEPRQGVLMGTTNKDTWSRDETGARRFWPVVCGTIDAEALRANRNQLFAEAMHEFRIGRQWHPDPDFELKVIKPIQDARYEGDAWEDPIQVFLASRLRTTVMEVAKDCLGFQTANLQARDQQRIVAILRQAKWGQQRGAKGTRYWAPLAPGWVTG